MSCRYDRDREEYLADGEPCRRDEYGDPTHHCTARRTCAQHVGLGELTCTRCVNRARTNVRQIVNLAALMMPVALGAGTNSEAANLAGPAADVEAWSWRKVAARQGRSWHLSLVEDEDEDEHHPYTVLTRWQLMLSEDYGHPLPPVLTVVSAADYLERNLHIVAQDDEQDFPLLNHELRKCRNHLEAVLGDSTRGERGAPCPVCDNGKGEPTLSRIYGHWCDEDDCERIHYDTDQADRWVCPRNEAHWWTDEDYRRWVADVYDTAGA